MESHIISKRHKAILPGRKLWAQQREIPSIKTLLFNNLLREAVMTHTYFDYRAQARTTLQVYQASKKRIDLGMQSESSPTVTTNPHEAIHCILEELGSGAKGRTLCLAEVGKLIAEAHQRSTYPHIFEHLYGWPAHIRHDNQV